MDKQPDTRGLVLICALAVLVGVIGGLGAWVFRLMIGLVHNLLFLGRFDLFYDATRSPVTRLAV